PHVHAHVHAVEHGAGQARPVAAALLGRARAGLALAPGLPAGAGVGGQDQLEPCRVPGDAARGVEGDVPGLEQLARRVEQAGRGHRGAPRVGGGVMAPVASGCRGASGTRAGSAGGSSGSSTPACAREIAPGRGRPGPPPTKAAVEAVWWGFSKGGVVRTPPRASNRPSTERIAETVWASWASSGGRMLGRREAIMVLPVPGGPVSSRWWAPAAATSAARRARAWPSTSAKSGRRVAGSVPAGSGSAATDGSLA